MCGEIQKVPISIGHTKMSELLSEPQFCPIDKPHQIADNLIEHMYYILFYLLGSFAHAQANSTAALRQRRHQVYHQHNLTPQPQGYGTLADRPDLG